MGVRRQRYVQGLEDRCENIRRLYDALDVLPGTLDKFMIRIKEKMRTDEIDIIINALRQRQDIRLDNNDKNVVWNKTQSFYSRIKNL